MTIISDVIYHFIDIPDVCKKFIDTPEFNRLRRIKQLGLVHYVYPSATHTRFEHSIGVMFLAGKVADILNINGREKELLQIAGLLHDIGHVSFSHLFDYILEDKIKKLPEINNKYKKVSKHEYRSIIILKTINNRLRILTDQEIQIVSKMILGDSSNEEKPFLFQIINNKLFGIDVDRIDYLQRDLYHLALPCFHGDYIIRCLRIKNNNLAILDKAKSEVEMLFEARKRFLTIACRHKTVLKIEQLIRQILDKTKIADEWFLKNWIDLDDYTIYTKIKFYPEFQRIETRNLEDIDISVQFEHIIDITKEDITKQINNVVWF